MSCVICCETINKVRKPVTCPLCEKQCCSKCFGSFLLETRDPNCMFCEESLSMDFVYDNSTKTFMDTFNKTRFEKRFELEQSRLPETQEAANRVKTEREIDHLQSRATAERNVVAAEIKLWQGEMYHLTKKKHSEEEVTKIKNKLSDLNEKRRQIVSEMNRVAFLKYKKEEKKVYVKKCPDSDCRGFLSTANKCGCCDKYFCMDCNVAKNDRTDEEHVCDPDTKATYDLLKKDSKPCPKCDAMIYKINGCSQMWCVKCHTAFDWNTGKIFLKGYIHNPEYFRYLRENNMEIARNPNDVVCGANDNFRMPTHSELNRSIKISSFLWTGWYEYLMHVRHWFLPSLETWRVDYTDLRIAYLNEDITLEEWKKTLKMRLKRDELNNERYLILDMYCNVMCDIFHSFVANPEVNVAMFHKNCREIFEYTNNQILKVQDKFKSKDTRYLLSVNDSRISFYFSKDFARRLEQII